MPATPRNIPITPEDVEAAQRGPSEYSYADIEVPGDYVATLVDVNDHITDNGESWKFTFEIMGCPFDEYTSFNKNARWKLMQVVQALGFPIEQEESLADFDPNAYIGTDVGATVDWQHDIETHDGPNYREIKQLYSLDGVDVVEDEEEGAQEPAAL